jgi:soluble lytic murein transglycosylase-like protein
MKRLMAACVVVMAAAAPGTALAGGMPLRVWETMEWAQVVLAQDAPGMDADVRKAVARTVAEEAHSHGMDPAVVLAVMKVESRYRVDVVSARGARGLMQVMPTVARTMTAGNVDRQALLDPETNVRLGVTLLASLVKAHHGNLAEGLAAYNMGSRKVRSLLKGHASLRGEDFRYARAVMREAGRLKSAYAGTQITLAMDNARRQQTLGWLD